MRVSRKQMLDEMGLKPQWILRTEPPVVRGETPPPDVIPEAVGGRLEVTAGRDTIARKPAAGLPPEGLGWEALRQSIHACTACPLCRERKQAVPGVGDENADWLFIGEGPGAEEDARGEPFVGQAGKLLDAMLESIGLRRGEGVYIANAVKCRPPANRTPEAPELAACRPYLERQIALIRPRLIVLLGKVAVDSVLAEDGALGRLRGKPLFYDLDGRKIPVVVTYHPAYLLRNLPDKAKAWEDLCRARRLVRESSGESGG